MKEERKTMLLHGGGGGGGGGGPLSPLCIAAPSSTLRYNETLILFRRIHKGKDIHEQKMAKSSSLEHFVHSKDNRGCIN